MNGTIYQTICDLFRMINTLHTERAKKIWTDAIDCASPDTLATIMIGNETHRAAGELMEIMRIRKL